MDMKSNQYYKNEALSALRGNWANALVATIILVALALFFSSNDAINSYYQRIVINPFIGYSLSFVSLFVLLPLAVGYSNSMRVLLETGDNRLANNSFSLGFGNWLHVVWGMILSTIYIFLWTLLLIIPGIIKSYSYALTPYILVEHPEMSANEAIEESMSDGRSQIRPVLSSAFFHRLGDTQHLVFRSGFLLAHSVPDDRTGSLLQRHQEWSNAAAGQCYRTRKSIVREFI